MIQSLDLGFFDSNYQLPSPDASGDEGQLWLIGEPKGRPTRSGSLEMSAERADVPSYLLRTFQDAGPERLGDYSGAFAGVWQQSSTIHLFRDALGMEPLHYRLVDGALHVHSDPLPLARLAGPPRLDREWLAGYLLTLPEAQVATPYEGVKRVPPGSIVTIERGKAPKIRTYWNPALDTLDVDFDTAVDAAQTMMDRVLADHAKAPLLLSAGLDSSVMLSRLAALDGLGDAITGSPSSHAEGDGSAMIDEYPVAHAAYRSVDGSGEHYRLRAAPSGLREAIDWAFDAFQRPVYNPSNLGWMDGCQALVAGLGSKVALEGTIGNFTLGHAGEPAIATLAAERDWGGFVREAIRRRGRGIRYALREAPPDWAARLETGFSARRKARAVFLRNSSAAVASERRRAGRRGYRANRPIDGYAFPERRLRDVIQQLDLAPPRRAAMRRHGIDLVDPYADPELVQFSLRLPDALYRQADEGRCVQRAMTDPRLPEIIRTGRVNGVQGADWRAAAIRDAALMRKVIGRLRDGHRGSEIFDVERIDKAVRDWPVNGWEREDQLIRYRVHLTRALMGAAFAQWIEEQ